MEAVADNSVVMSADIAGSTALYETLGDARAREIVAACLGGLRDHCAAHRGHVLAEVGDQIVARFDAATDAAGVASEIHAQLHEQAGETDGPLIRMRIGLHYGPLPHRGDVLLGETVKIANWASNNAKPEQTLATRSLVEQLPRIFRAVSRYVDDETWNFVSLEHVELYEIIWDVEAITAYVGEKPVRSDYSYDKVSFTHAGVSATVDSGRPVISIGRGEHNDLVIRCDLVSRQHLSAQYSRGRCTVTDNSTNGSVVVMEDGTRYELKRDSLRLYGSGVIIPGRPDTEEASFPISFRCF
ncbi:MAG: adenylate/guanylate cyclase domain-containing protein [Gammaproteobacteria bacterium]